MDFNFWAGIVIAAVVSVPLSIFANIYSDDVRKAIARFRGLRLAKREAKEASIYREVKAIQSGDVRANTDLILLDIRSTRRTIWAIIGAGEFMIVFAYFDSFSHFAPESLLFGIMLLITVAIVYFIVGAFFIDLRTAQIARRLRQFEAYEDEILDRWGADALDRWKLATG